MTKKIVFDEQGLKIWFGDQDEPNLLQPTWPDGTPWANQAEAESWGQQALLANDDDTADLPGNSPNESIIPRVTPEMAQLAQDRATANAKLIALGLTPEEIAAITGA